MVAAAIFSVGVSTTPQAKAANLTWSQTAVNTYSWTDSANWGGTGFPNAIGDIANLSGALAGAQTVNLNAVITIGELNFGASAPSSAAGFTLAGGTNGLLVLDDTDGAVSINKLNVSPSLDTISADIQFNDNLTITNNSSAGTLTLGTMRSVASDVTLTGTGAVAAGSTITGVISTAGNLIKSGTGIVQLNGASTYAGTTTISAGRLIANVAAAIPVRSAITIETGAILEPKAALTFGSLAGGGRLDNPNSTARTITVGRNDTSTTFSGTITSATAANILIVKLGAGTLLLQPTGTNASTFTGVTTVNGGKITLDTSSSTLTSAFLAATPLTLAGGNFEMVGRSGAPTTQTLGAFVVGAAGGAITMTANGGTSTELILGAVTATASGGSLLITAPSTTTVKLGTAILSTALNGRAVFSDGTANTFNWVTNATTATAVSGFVPTTALPIAGGGTTTASYLLTASQNQTTANLTIGTLKLSSTSTSAQTLGLGSNNMQLGGGTAITTPGAILIDGTASWNITGTGALAANTPATSPDLIFQHYGTGTLTVNAPIGGGVTSLVKAGPGTMVLAGTNTFTGDIALNGGVLSFGAVGNVATGLGAGVAKAIRIRDGATLRYTGATGTIAAGTSASSYTFSLTGGNANIEVTTAATALTLSGVISGDGGYTKLGSGTLIIGASSTFLGPLFINAGTVRAGGNIAVTSTSSPVTIGASGTLDINGTGTSQVTTIGSLSGSGVVTNSNTTAKTISVGSNNTSTTFSGTFAAGGVTGNVIRKVGSGVLTLTGTSAWTGTTDLQSGVLRIGANNALATNAAMTIGNVASGVVQLQIAANTSQTLGANSGGTTALSFYGTAANVFSNASVLIENGATLTIGATNITFNGTGVATGNPQAFISAAGTGRLSLTNNRTFNIGDSSFVGAGQAELVVSAPISSVGDFGPVKSGFGNLLFAGTNTYTGSSTLTAGGLFLDYATLNTTKLNAAGALALNGGGNLILLGNASADTAQAVASTTLASGGFSTIRLTPGGSQKIVLTLGAFTRAATTGTVRFNLPTGTQNSTNGFRTTSTNLNGILGAWATVADAAGATNFAANDGSGGVVLVTSATKSDITTWAAADHVTDGASGYSGTLAQNLGVNSLRFNSAADSTVTIADGRVLTIISGGVLQTSTASGTTLSPALAGGRLVSGASNELIFTTDVTTPSRPLVVSSAIGGAQILTKTGDGTLKLSGINDFTGVTYLKAGTLQVEGGNAIGDTSLLNMSTTRASVFQLLANETVGGVVGGQSAQGGQGTIDIGVFTLRLNQASDQTYSGLVSGTGTLIKDGVGALTININSSATFTGPLQVVGGQFRLSGNDTASGGIGSTVITVANPGSQLHLNQDNNNSPDRIVNTAVITLNNTAPGLGLFFRDSNDSASNSESIGSVILGAGHNVIAADYTGGTATRFGTLTLGAATDAISRTNNATTLVVGRNLGSIAYGAVVIAENGGRIAITNAPTGANAAVGGGGANGTATASIFPYMIGQATTAAPTDDDVGNSFVRLSTNGLRPLSTAAADAEYVFESAGFNALAASTASNVRFTATPGATLTASGASPRTINSLVIDSTTAAVTVTGPGADSLALTSGALLSTGAAANNTELTGFAGITTATNNEYVVFVTNNQFTLGSPLTTSAAALTKSGAGVLVLNGLTGNTYSGGTFFNQGLIAASALGNLGSGNLNFFGGGLRWSTGSTFDISARPVVFGTGGATFDTNGNNVVLASSVGAGGAGGFTKTGSGNLTFAASASYLGATFLQGSGRVILSGGGDNRLGLGPLTLASNAALQLGDVAGSTSQTVGLLAGDATNAVVGGSEGRSTLTVNQAVNSIYAGSLGGAGAQEGNLSLIKGGVGVLTLSGASLGFNGALTVNAGTLHITGGTTAAPPLTSLAVGGGATLNFANGAGQRINLGSGTLTLGSAANASVLGLDLGSASAYDGIITAGPATMAGTVVFNITDVGMASGTYNLLQAASGLDGANYVFGTLPGGYVYSTASSATSVDLTVVTALDTLYWQGSRGNGFWADQTAPFGGSTNWSTDLAGLTNAGGIPGLRTAVIFSSQAATVGSPVTTTVLERPLTIDRLVFNGERNGGAVTGILINPGDAGVLTITPSSSVNGINIQAGAPIDVTIAAPVVLGGPQTWTVADAGTLLTIGGVVTGGRPNSDQTTPGINTSLTIKGAGEVTLDAAANTFTGDIVVDGGGYRVNGAADWGGATIASSTSKTITLINGGRLILASALTYNPTNSGTSAYTLIRVGEGGGTFAIPEGSTLQLDDAGQLYGAGTLTKSGGGTLSLRNLGTSFGGFTGNIVVSGGIIQPSGGTGFNLGTIDGSTTIQSGAALNLNGISITEAEPLFVNGAGLASAPIAAIYNSSATAASFPGPVTLATSSSVGGANALTLSGSVNGVGGLTKVGAGTLTISGSMAIDGGLTVTAGTLTVSGSSVIGGDLILNAGTLNFTAPDVSFSGALTVSGGTLNLTGAYAKPPQPSSLVLAAGASLNLVNTVGQHVNLGAGTLNLGAGTGSATFSLELGSGSNYDRISATGNATTANTVVLNLSAIGGFGAGNYDLLSAGTGLGGATYTVTGLTGSSLAGYALSLSAGDSLVRLTSSAVTGDFYWDGTLGTTTWASFNSTSLQTNWSTDAAGDTNVRAIPGLHRVIFSSDDVTGTSLSTTLDAAFSIKDLVFNNQRGSGPLTAITIATGTGGSLKLTPGTAADGINLQAGAPAAVTISAPLALGANQTWTVADAATTLTVSGALTGAYGLTKAGSGVVVLSSAVSAYTGATTVTNGTLRAGATQSFSPYSSLEVQSGATVSLNSFTQRVAALTGAGTVNNMHSSTAATLVVGLHHADSTFAGLIANGAAGTMALQKAGEGVLTLAPTSAANTATGGITVTRGSVLFDHSVSTLTSLWSSTGTITLRSGGLAWKANPSTQIAATLGALTVDAGPNFLTVNPNGATSLQTVTLGAVTATAVGGTLLVTSPDNTAVRLGTAYSSSTTVAQARLIFTKDGSSYDYLENAGATTASQALQVYSSSGLATTNSSNDALTRLHAGSFTQTGNLTTEKIKIKPDASGQSYSIGTGNLLTLNSGGILFHGDQAYSIDGGSLRSNTATNSELIVHTYGGQPLTLSSNIVNGNGASVFTKAGNGILNLTGQIQSTGATYVNQGVLNIQAAQSILGNLVVQSGVLNVNAAVTGNASSTILDLSAAGSGGRSVVNVAADMLLFGTKQGGGAGSANVYNQTAGIVTVSPGIGGGDQFISSTEAGAYGYFNLTGGTYKHTTRFQAGRASTYGGSISVLHVGGTGFLDHTNAEWFLNYGVASYTVTGSGLIDHTGSSSAFGLYLNTSVRDGTWASLNLAGGTVRTGGRSLQIGNSATAGSNPDSQAFINLAAGTLSTGANFATNLPVAANNSVYFTAAGGTLLASGNLSAFLPATIQGAVINAVIYGAVDNKSGSNDRGTTTGFRSAAPDFTGGLTIDTAGFNVAIQTPIRGAAGVKVTQADMTLVRGSGYIGAPLVRFSSEGVLPGGSPAQGYAMIDAAAGEVIGIVITNPGTYVAGTVPKLDLIGGGGLGASVTISALSAANSSGGLTKAGNGTLLLQGFSTYSGGTFVDAGTLTIGGDNNLNPEAPITVGGGNFDVGVYSQKASVVTLNSGQISGSTGRIVSDTDFLLRAGSVLAKMAGTGGVHKTTAGTVTLSGANVFSGAVTVAAGRLQFAADAHLGDGSLTNFVNVDGGALVFTPASSLTLSANRAVKFGPAHATVEVSDAAGVLTFSSVDEAGTGNLTKAGQGRLILPGVTSWNSGLGTVTVEAGVLQAGFGADGVSAINLGAAGTLSLVNLNAEVLTLAGSAGSLNITSGATIGFELGASGVGDRIVVGSGGTAVLTPNGSVTLNLYGLGAFGAGSFELLSAPSGLSTATYTLGSAPSGYNYTINASDTLVSVDVVSFIPRYWSNAQSTGSWSTLAGGTGSNWATMADGSNDYAATPVAADTVIFSAGSLSGGALSTTLDGSFTIEGLQFLNATSSVTTSVLIAAGTGGSLTLAPSSTSGGISVGTNAGTVTISAPLVLSTGAGASSQTWAVDGTGTSSLLVSGDVTFGAPVRKTGAGVLTLTGANTGAGGLTLAAGALRIGSATALGSGTLVIRALTTFDNASGADVSLTAGNDLELSGSFTFTGTHGLSFGSGDAVIDRSLAATISANTLTVGTLSDGSGSFDLTKSGPGGLTVTGAMTIGGAVTLSGGALSAGAGSVLGQVSAASGTTLSLTSSDLASLSSTSATVTLAGDNEVAGVVTIAGGTFTASGSNNFGGAVQVNSGTVVLGGNNSFTSLALASGVLTLAGANSFTGGVAMSGGTLNLNNDGALGAGTLTISAGTLNNTSGGARTLAGVGAGALNGNFTFTGASSLNLGTASLAIANNPVVTVSASTLGFAGSVTGSTDFFKAGAGTLTVGSLAHAGSISVNAGTLSIQSASTYSGNTNLGTNATLIMAGSNELTTSILRFTGSGSTLNLANASATFNSIVVAVNSATENTITIGSGQVLRSNGTVTVGIDGAGATNTRLTMSGLGAFYVGEVGTPTGTNFQLGNHTTQAFSNDARLNMSGLSTLYANLGGGVFRVGDPSNGTGGATAGSTLRLARTSTIISSSITLDTPNGSVTNAIYLGDVANVFNTPSLSVGAGTGSNRAGGFIGWDTGVLTGSFRLRGLDGADSSAAANLAIASGNATTGFDSTSSMVLSGHDSDLLVTTLAIGGGSGGSGTPGHRTGTLTFDTGTLVATTVNVGTRTGGFQVNNAITGTLNLMSAGGTGSASFTTLLLGQNSSSAAATNGAAIATLNIGGGTVAVSGTMTLGNNSIGGGSTAQTAAPVQATANISGGTVTIGTLNMNVNSSANTGTGNASLASLNISGGSVGVTNLSLAAPSAAAATATSAISLTGGTLTLGANLAYTQSAGTANTTLTLNGGTLDMGGYAIGSLALPVGSGSGALNLQSGTLRNVSEINGGAAISKTGAGVLTLAGTNTFTGGVTVTGGLISVSADAALGATSGPLVLNGGGLQVTGTAFTSWTNSSARTLTLSGATTFNIADQANAFTLGVSAITAAGTFTKAGAGRLVVTNALTMGAHALNVTAGTLVLENGFTNATGGSFRVGDSAGSNAAFVQTGGTTVLLTADGETMLVGTGGNSFGSFTIAGGTFQAPRLQPTGTVGTNNSGLVSVLSGGTLRLTTYFIGGRTSATNTGVVTIAGGTLDLASLATGSGAWGGGRYEVNLGANLGGANTGGTFDAGAKTLNAVGNTTTSQGIINLLGGTLTVGSVSSLASSTFAQFNMNGGVLKAGAASATFLSANLTAANVYSGGVTIDNNGFAITLAKSLDAPAGNGVASVAVTGASGYFTAPLVKLTGGGGNGDATAVAVLNEDGTISVVITNPGTNYTSAPTVTLVGGTTGTAATASATLNSGNTSGGITFQGSATTTLSANNTYAGTTTISEGVLAISTSGGLGSTAGHTIVASGASLRLVTNNFGLSENLTLSGTGIGTGSAYGALNFNRNTGIFGINGVVTLSGGAAINTFNSATANLTFAQGIQGTGNLTLRASAANNGGAVYALNGASSYTGDTTLSTNNATSGVTVINGVNNALPATTVLRLLATSGTTTFGKYQLNGFSQEVAGLEGAVAANTLNSIVGGSATLSTLTVNNSGDYTFAGQLGNTGTNENNLALIKSGSGTLTLSGANTFGGATLVSAGTLTASTGALGGTSGITVNGATLTAADYNLSATLALNASGTATLSGTGLNISGAVTNANTTANALNFTGTSAKIILASLAGAGATRFGSDADITGGVSVGTVTVVGTLGAGISGGTVNAGALNGAITGGTVTVTNLLTGAVSSGTVSAGALTGNVSGGSVTVTNLLTGNVTAGTVSAGSMTGDVSSSVTVSGLLTGAITAGTNALGSLSSSSVTGGTNTISGAATITTVDGGTTSIGGVATITTLTSGTVTLTGATAAIGALNGGTVALGTTALTVDGGTFAGVISGLTGAIIKATNGTLTLSGTNTFGGGTTLSAGTLTLGNVSALGTGAITVASGATLNLNNLGVSNAITVATGGNITGGPQADSPAVLAKLTGTNSIDTVLTGSVGLEKTDGGELTLSTPNFFTGAVEANVAGAVIKAAFLADTSSSLGTSTLTDPANLVLGSGATLEFTGGTSTSTARSFTIGGSAGIAATGTGTLEFTSASQLATTGSAPALTLTANNAGTNRFAASLVDGNTGLANLAINGTGTWVIGTGANRFKNDVRIEAAAGATIGLENSSLPSGATLAVANNATIRWEAGNATGVKLEIAAGTAAKLNLGSNNVVFSSAPVVASGSGTTANFEKQGSGTLTIGASVNAGALNFTLPENAGMLSVGTGGSIGNVSLATGSRLGGSGMVGAIMAAAGSTIAPGNSPGVMTAASMTIAGNTTFLWEVQDPQVGPGVGGYDKMVITGSLDLTGATAINKITIKINSLTADGVTIGNALNFGPPNGVSSIRTFEFASVQTGSSGVLLGSGLNISDVFQFDLSQFTYTGGATSNAGLWSIDWNQTSGAITLTAVPEPSTYGFGLGALALAAAAIRRRKRQAKA
jgi:autotransporter-associated beta strand protein